MRYCKVDGNTLLIQTFKEAKESDIKNGYRSAQDPFPRMIKKAHDDGWNAIRSYVDKPNSTYIIVLCIP